eukprot:1294331-Pleurochrysis_carterae.AAC.4
MHTRRQPRQAHRNNYDRPKCGRDKYYNGDCQQICTPAFIHACKHGWCASEGSRLGGVLRISSSDQVAAYLEGSCECRRTERHCLQPGAERVQLG